MNDQPAQPDFHPFIKLTAFGLFIFYAIDIAVSALWGFHYLRPMFDKATVLLKIASDILFCAGALFIFRRKSRGLTLAGLGAVLLLVSLIISKVYILAVNYMQGTLPNIPFFILTLIQSLIWPIAVLGIMNWDELKKQLH